MSDKEWFSVADNAQRNLRAIGARIDFVSVPQARVLDRVQVSGHRDDRGTDPVAKTPCT